MGSWWAMTLDSVSKACVYIRVWKFALHNGRGVIAGQKLPVLRKIEDGMKELPAEKLDPRIKSVWRLSDVLAWTCVLACCLAVGAFGAFLSEEEASWFGIYALVCLVVYGAMVILFVVVITPVRYARWRYQLSPEFLTIAHGIIWRKHMVVPFIRVQNTDTQQGPILRFFGLASVTVSTAAGSIEIPGLRADEAEEVRDRAAELARIAREDV